jgi:hypothetical protein
MPKAQPPSPPPTKGPYSGMNANTIKVVYTMGYDTYAVGLTDKECPYPVNNPKRVDWMLGYYWARVYLRIGHILDRY